MPEGSVPVMVSESQGLKWQVVTDFADLAPELHRLYLNVLARSDYRLETLTPAFFRNVSESLGEQSFVIVAMDGDKPVAFELFIRDETRICPMYSDWTTSIATAPASTSIVSTASSRKPRCADTRWSSWGRRPTA